MQSAVSAAVRTLERELGARLFDRSTRRVAITDAGHALLPEARGVLAAAALAADAVSQVGHGLRGAIELGAMQAQGMRAVPIPRLIATFRLDHPRVQVSVRHVGGSRERARQVREGRLDLAILSLSEPRSAGLNLTPLASEAMLLACTGGHPLAGRDRVDLPEIAAESFVDMPEGWGLRMATDRAFARVGESRAVSFEVSDTASIIEFVREGLAVALLRHLLPGARRSSAGPTARRRGELAYTRPACA